LAAFLWRKLKVEILLDSLSSLSSSENLSSTPLQGAESGFQIDGCYSHLKIVLKASYDKYTGKNRPKTAKVSRNRNFDTVFATLFTVSN